MPAAQRIDTGTHEGSCWWAVYTRHQEEKIVARMLLGKSPEVFLPLYDSARNWKEKNIDAVDVEPVVPLGAVFAFPAGQYVGI